MTYFKGNSELNIKYSTFKFAQNHGGLEVRSYDPVSMVKNLLLKEMSVPNQNLFPLVFRSYVFLEHFGENF